MRILVTGAAGFAGRHIAAHLAAAGHHVVAGYRSAPLPPALAAAPNIEPRHLKLNGSPPAVPPEPGEFEAIIHAAATAPGLPSVTDGNIVDDGVPAVKAMLALADAARATRIIYLSSISIYGQPDVANVNEFTYPLNPSLYGRAKFLGERLVSAWANADSARSAISLRLPAIIGPGARRVWLSHVAAALKQDAPVKIYNPAHYFNNAVHVADLATLCERLIRWPRIEGHIPLVLGANDVAKVSDVVAAMAAVLLSKSKPVTDSAPRPSFLTDSWQAKTHYGYRPMNTIPMVKRYAAECRE